MRVIPAAKRYFLCVVCGNHEFIVEHVMARGGEYFWACDDCGASNRVVVQQDGTLDVTHDAERDIRYALAVARLTEQRPVYAVMRVIAGRADNYGVREQTPDEEHVRYWLEEHTCPTNPDIIDFVVDGDPDMHGMWKLIGLAPDYRSGRVRLTHEILDHITETAPQLARLLAGE